MGRKGEGYGWKMVKVMGGKRGMVMVVGGLLGVKRCRVKGLKRGRFMGGYRGRVTGAKGGGLRWGKGEGHGLENGRVMVG